MSGARLWVDPAMEGKKLGPREKQIALLVVQGLQYKEIALQLGISRKTVETHVSSFLTKLGVSSRAKLVPFLIGEELLAAMAKGALEEF